MSFVTANHSVEHTYNLNPKIISGFDTIGPPVDIAKERYELMPQINSPARFPAGALLSYYPKAGQNYSIQFRGIGIDNPGEANEKVYVNLRPVAMAMTIVRNRYYLHPPATPMVALFRLCQRLHVSLDNPPVVTPLIQALIQKHYPELLLPAGRPLRPDERRMSIAYLADIFREEGESADHLLSRLLPVLNEYGLVELSIRPASLRVYFTEGLTQLRRLGWTDWLLPARGRPPKKHNQDGS